MKFKCVPIVAFAFAVIACKSKTPDRVATTMPASPTAPISPVSEIGPSAAPAMYDVLTPELAEGKTMFESKCANCHELYSPTSRSNEDWKPILVRMQNYAKIEDAHMALIQNYIYYNNK